MTKSFWTRSQVVIGALVASALIWGVSAALAKNHDSKFSAQDVDEEASAMSSLAAAPQATATPSGTPPPQIDGFGTINGPNGKFAQFFIFDVEDEQITPEFLEGEFGYIDKRSHINFTTGKIQTVTINGNQGTFTGTARIGGPRNRQTVQFTVMVTANEGAVSDTFSIQLSNGYSASGNLRTGTIQIRTLDPD